MVLQLAVFLCELNGLCLFINEAFATLNRSNLRLVLVSLILGIRLLATRFILELNIKELLCVINFLGFEPLLWRRVILLCIARLVQTLKFFMVCLRQSEIPATSHAMLRRHRQQILVIL